MSNLPNPGSAEAGSLNCSCSPLFNNHGRKPPPEGWRIRPRCPVHTNVAPEEEAHGDIVVVPPKALKDGWFRRAWRKLVGEPGMPQAKEIDPGPYDQDDGARTEPYDQEPTTDDPILTRAEMPPTSAETREVVKDLRHMLASMQDNDA